VKKILLIAGTRPNFIKLAPLYKTLQAHGKLQVSICHTGQHFDFNMSDIFWQNLQLPKPDHSLNIQGSGVADTIGKTILGINEVIKNEKFDLIIVFGDVNATAAGAITGSQSRIPVMHVEAGLRSYDRNMPEEINRVIADHVSDFLMVSEPSGLINLSKEGIAAEKVFHVGNIMIENLVKTRDRWENLEVIEKIAGRALSDYVVATFHRPENVDSQDTLKKVVQHVLDIAAWKPIVFPVHPRTKSKLEQYGLFPSLREEKNVVITEPLGYFEFLNLVAGASLVVTDSGGIQEETSYLKIPCVTFRKNTERPVTIQQGTNILLSLHDECAIENLKQHTGFISGKQIAPIDKWDEKVSERILAVIRDVMEN
jgi:UDP-N-acetylglucosamine 2-epimerase (non-hydrolysing)